MVHSKLAVSLGKVFCTVQAVLHEVFLNLMQEIESSKGGLMTTAVCHVIHDYILPQFCRPKSLPKQKYNSFDNIAVSLVHSTVTGIGRVHSLRIRTSYHMDHMMESLSGYK